MPVEGRSPGSRVRTEQHGMEAIGDEPSNAREHSDAATKAISEGQAGAVVHAFGRSLVREPDAGNPHVRFDERGAETEWLARLSETPTRKGGNGKSSHGLEPSPRRSSTLPKVKAEIWGISSSGVVVVGATRRIRSFLHSTGIPGGCSAVITRWRKSSCLRQSLHAPG
jgi:hypothetical protein